VTEFREDRLRARPRVRPAGSQVIRAAGIARQGVLSSVLIGVAHGLQLTSGDPQR